MAQFQFSLGPPQLTAIERPRCPVCDTRMMLARISPGPAGFDIRTFECAKCDHVLSASVDADPMKSKAAGWLKGELRAPE